MKKLYIFTLLLKRLTAGFLFFFISSQLSAQTITNYSFAASGGTFTNITGGQLPSSGGGTADEGYGNAIPIGFDFWYMGVNYTTISASSNGWIALGSDITNATPVNNLSAGGAPRPVIAPLWDDLDEVSTSNVTYVTTGTAGSRIFTIQYLTAKWSRTAPSATISFQVKLYEGTGKVQFIYRPESGNVAGASASIGITATATGSGNFLSLNGSGTNPTVSSTTATATISAKPASGQTYSFTPPVPSAPTNLTFSAIATTSMTLNWTDNSGTVEKGFVIYRSTDGITYNFVSQTAANAVSSAQSGLTANTIYYWKVYAVSEGGLSTALSGSQITCGTAPTISTQPTALSKCVGESATFSVTAAGTATLTYQWRKGGVNISGAVSSSYNIASVITADAGSYDVVVSVPCGTTVTSSAVSLTVNTLPSVSGVSTASCVGGSTGTITATGSGGTLPYTYSLNTGTYQSSAIFTGLAAGTYTLNIKSNAGCIASTSVAVSDYATSADDQNATSTDTWTGHAYDGTAFTNYIGHFTETETFDELFGGDAVCFNVVSNSVTRSIYTETFSVKYRMNSTKRGLYVADLGSDDGTRLTVDATMVYNNWSDQAFSTRPAVLMNLNGASSLLYEFYENGGANEAKFQNLTLVLANTLSTNTTQNICLGNTGSAISGDIFAVLPSGITLSGTGYQWTYSTTPGGARINISGATAATFSPSTAAAPFNAAGTYYIYRNAVLSSTNNIAPNPYVATNESNVATISVTTLPAATISYTGSPFCKSLAIAQSVTQTGTTGGTYTSTGGLTINASTGAITPSTSTAGTYTVTYTMAATGGCTAQTATASVTITTLPAAIISYSGSPFCKSIATAQPVTFTGTTGGTYVSTGGLTINASTGAVTPNTSTAGTYTVTYTMAAGGGCAAQTATANVTITTLPAATISYSGTPFCTSLGTAQPVTQTGTTGGTYSSLSALTLNTSTGAITPSTSTPGTYTVTYTMAPIAGCSAQTATTSVTITALPAATISYSGTPFCTSLATAQPVTQTGTTGGTYSSTVGLTINSSTGAITPGTSTAGSYVVTYTMAATGGCAVQTAFTLITITTLPVATISYSGSPFCKSLATAQPVTQTGTTGGTYTSTAGLTINASTGAITASTSTAGTYTVTYTMAATGGCAVQTATNTVIITDIPTATISYTGSPYCSNAGTAAVNFTGTTGGTYTSTAGLTINSATGAVTLGTSTPGTYTVTYTIAAAGGCSIFTTTATITITAAPAASFSYTGTPYCSNAGIASVGFSGTTGGTYTSTAGLTINSATGAVTLGTSTAGTYTVTYTIAAAGGCSIFTTTATIIVTAAPSATISYAGSPYCTASGTATVTKTGTAGGTYSSTTGLVINAATGDINLATSTTGTYTVTYTIAVAGGCSIFTTTTTVSVFAIGNNLVDYINGAHGVICSTAGENTSATLTAPAGTVFINVAFASYGTAAGTCGAFTMGACHATTSQAVTEDYLLGNNTGTIPATNAVFGDPCVGTGKQLYVQVIYTQPICSGTAPGTITGTTPTGGNAAFTYLWEQSITSASAGFSAAGGTNNTKDYIPGTLTQTTWYRRTVISGGCSNTSTVIQITVTSLPAATISYTGTQYCSNAGTASVTRTGTTGGTYSSTAGLTINAATGDITLASSTAGTYTVTYTMAATGGCTVQTANASITITTLPAATISYNGSPYCSSLGTVQAVTFSGTTGGVFSSTGGLTINASTGAVTPATSTAGTYTVTYTMGATGGCAVQTATATATITTVAAATISYAGSPFCVSVGTAQPVTQTGTAGGVYSSVAVLTINATTGAITPATSTPGTYTVTYTMAATGGCAAQTATTSVTITALPTATIAYSGSPFCNSVATAQTVTLTGTTGGVYTSSAGLTINASTGAITPNTSTAGTYTVTYTMSAAGGCAAQTATTSVTITTLPVATIAYSGSPFCNSVATAQTVTQTGTGGGIYSSAAGLTINASTGAITPNTSTAGTYTVIYTMAATGGCIAQTATSSVTITALPAATISYSGSPFCSNAAPGSVTISGTAGGTYSSTAGLTINASTGVIIPATSTIGTYTVTYTMAAAGGCSAQTATTSVTITTLSAATISYSASPFCKSVGTAQTVTQTGTTGGAYSSTAGLSIDAVTGDIIPATSVAGSYTVTYTMAATGGCTVQTATTSITINPIPSASFSYPGSPYSVTAGTASVSFSGTTGGTYSSTAGLTLNATTGDVTLSSSTPGTYTVTYTVAAAGGCSVYNNTATITVVASTKIFTGTGNFSDPLRWTGGTLPTAGENLVIDGACTVDNSVTTDNIAYGTLIIGTATGRTLNWIASGTNRLNVSNVSAGAGASALNMTNGGTLIIRGTWASASLAFTPGNGTIEIQSTVTLPVAYTTFKNLTVNGSGITVKLGVATTVSGNLTITNGTLSSNNLGLSVKGNWINNVSTAAFTAGTATATFNGTTAQTIGGSFATTFTNLTIANTSSTVSLNINASVTGNLSVTVGTFDLGSFTANRATAGGTLSLSNNTSLRIGGTNTFPTNYTTNTLVVASTVEYYGTNQTVAAKTYGNLTLSSASGAAVKTFAATAFAIVGNLTSTLGAGSSVSFTAAAILTITGNVTIGASTTFSGGSFAHSVAGNWINNGTFNGNTGTITFSGPGKGISGSGTQNFNNLTVSASLFTFSNGSISVSGNLATISSGSLTQASGGTLLMTGTAKTISGTGISIDNLTVSGTITSAASFSLTGNLSVSGSITASAGIITMSGTTKTIAGTGTRAFAGLLVSGSVTTAVSFSIASSLNVTGSFSASAGTATFTGTSTLSGTANLFNTTINGTSLQLTANSTLGIAGTLTITAGTLNVSSSIPNTVNFNSAGAQNINAITYNNLVISNGNTKTAVGAITTNKDITIGSGTIFIASSYTHSIYGNWTNYGTFVAGTSTVQFAGSATTYLTGATTFNILTSNTSSASTETIFNDNVSASVVNMINGIFTTGSDTITITNTRTGNGFIYGNIQRNHTFTTGVAYAFEGPNNTVSFSAVSGVNSITVSAVQTAVGDFPFGNAIGRYYNIAVPVGTYTAILRLHYEDDELNGNPENDMAMWKDSAQQWIPIGKTANDTVANYVEHSGLTDITRRWTCSINPTVVLWNGSVSSDWNTAANWTVYVGSGSTPPAATDIAVLGGLPFTYQPTISTAAVAKNLVFVAVQPVTLTMASGGSLTAGDMQGVWYNDALHTINTNGQPFTINGNMSLSDGVTNHAIDLNIGSGSVNVFGSLTQTGGANINFSSTGTLNIHQNFDHSSGTFAAGSGTVIYNGDQNQHVAPVNYNDLTINKAAGLAAIDSVVNIAGNLLISAGELDNNSLTTITGNVTIATGARLQNNHMLHVAGNWNNSGNYVGTGAHIVFNGSGTQTISATTFNNVVINKPVGSVAVLTDNIALNGDLTVASGTLDVKSFSCDRTALGGTLTLGDSATFIVGGNNSPVNYASGNLSNSSTVIANGTGPQYIFNGTNFGNLILRNAGLKTLVTGFAVNGDLTIENGATLDGGAQTVTLKGNWTNSGTYIPSNSTIIVTGIGKTISGVTTFHRFSVYGSYTALSNLTFDSLLSVNSGGAIYGGSNIVVTMNGDLVNSGTLYNLGTTTYTGNVVQTLSLINATQTVAITVNFNGTVSPVLNSTTAPLYGFLNINNTGGINPSVDWTVLYAMTVGSGASFNGGNAAHNFLGAVTNNGTITSDGILNFIPSSAAAINLGSNFSSTGLVNFGGAGAVTLAGNPLSFQDVEISNTNAAGITPPTNWTIANNFTVDSFAIFNAGNHTYFVGNDAVSSGTINSGTSTFTFNGAGNQTIRRMTFYNLEAANTGSGIALLNATVNNNLAVSTGRLSIGNNTIPRTIAVNGNITIANGTTFNVDTASDATHQLTVSGNIINSGNLNLRPDANSLCNVTFNKVGTQTISGTGATTNFNNITVNMGVADTNHLDVTATNFNAPNGFLTLNNGSFNLNNAAVNITPFAADITNGNFLIPATTGLWVNAGTINSSNMNWTVAGTVKVAGGTMNMGNTINNVVIPKATAHILVNGGNLNLASAISNPGAAWAYNMQDGTMTINTQGSNAAGVAAFNMDASGSSFSMSGGTLIIKDAGGSAGQNLGYKNLATAGAGFTGGTLQIGNSLTTASSIFGLVSTNPIYNLTVNSGNATAILQAPVLAVNNNVTVTTGKLNLDTLTLKIGGAISNSGTFIAANGTIEMNGTSAQTIPAAAFQGNNLKGLTINNNAGVTLAGAINLTDVLTITNGSLAAGGYLTLKSTATATARVARITSAASTPITGNVTAERYVPGRRKYRLITSPVTTSTSATLTAGQEALSMWFNWQNSGNNASANMGELITGGSVADGFDQGTTNASLYTYDDVNRVFKGYTTANGKNTKYTPLKAGIAYLMFVYGDRQNSVFATVPHNTVLNAFGTLKTGDQTYNTGSAIPLTGVTGRFTLLGNPFASPIDWTTLPKTNLANTYWGWDPNLSSTGGYITVTTLGAVTISAPYSGSTGLNQYIQSGQGFFVKTIGASPTLTIREQDKVSNFNANAYRNLTGSTIPLIAVNLQYVSAAVTTLADGVLAVFDPSFTNTPSDEDATKIANSAESMAILNTATPLSIDARKIPQTTDTLFLNLSRLTKPQYSLQIFSEQMLGTGVSAFLQDKYLNTTQPLSLVDTNNIVFNINTGIPASYDIARFRIIFQASTIVLPLKFISIKANLKNKDIQVDWAVAEESDVKKYEIERSADGINFSKAGEVAARGNNTSESYNWLDVHPMAGNNFYRVRAIDVDGDFLLSRIVLVKISSGNTDFKILPNPVTDHRLTIHADEMMKGQYQVSLHNQQGQQIMQRMIDHPGAVFNQIITLDSMLPAGIYYLQITGEAGKYNIKIFIK